MNQFGFEVVFEHVLTNYANLVGYKSWLVVHEPHLDCFYFITLESYSSVFVDHFVRGDVKVMIFGATS